MKNWFITGVGSGLGRALAEAALRRGDRVVGTSRSAAGAAAFEAAFGPSLPGSAVGLRLDVTDEAAVRAAVARAEALTGGIDVLVNNAGYGLVAGVEAATQDEVRAQFEINLMAPLMLMQAVLPRFRARRAGRILNVSSVSGRVGWPSLGIYSASKFALEGLTETLAQEVAGLGIHVTLVEPGGFRTAFAGGSRVHARRVIDDYDATVGACMRILAEHAGHEPGDPRKAALAMLAVADAEHPPLRLLLGADALGYVLAQAEAERAEIVTWRDITLGTDFDDTPASG